MNYYFKVFENYATFSGRARRSEYWYFILFHFIVTIILSVIGVTLGSMIPYYLYNVAVIIPGIALGVRRMHDVGKSGWYLLIPIYSLILCCTEGEPRANQYGENPKYSLSY